MKKRMILTIVVEGEGPLYDLVVEEIKLLKDAFDVEYLEDGPFGNEGELKQSATIIEEELGDVC